MVIFGKTFSSSSVSFKTDKKEIADIYASFLSEECETEPETLEREGKKITVLLKKASDRRKVLEKFGHSQNEVTLRINRANIADDCCFSAFLRGVFLSCGTVTSPEKSYHLEFVVPFLKLSNDLFSIMSEMELEPKHVVRKGSHIIYFKDSEKIEDILTLMGAMNSSLRFMGIKMNKDMRNHVNRRVNFETANIGRSVNASAVQIEAINKIIAASKFDELPEPLQRTARLRLENPEASLNELERLTDHSVSRSGINHRLTKLTEIADGLFDDKEKN